MSRTLFRIDPAGLTGRPRDAVQRTPVLVWLALLALLGCQRDIASAAGDKPLPREDTAEDSAQSAPSSHEPTTWPWENDSEFLRQREKAVAKLYSVGVYCFPRDHEFEWHRLNDENVQKTAARLCLAGFSTVVGDDEFGYSPDRGTDKLTDQIFLENMKWFPEIMSLSLISTDISDEGIKAIQEMPHLKSFRLLHLFPPVHPCRITDDGMRVIAKCTSLQELTFLGTKLTDTGVEHLSRLPNLKRITIEATYVTPNCLRPLVSVPALEEIVLRGNRRVSGCLSYRDIADYDHLCTPITPSVERSMGAAQGGPRQVRIEGTLAIDPSVFEALCRTPTVERIEMQSYADWNSASALAALHGQEHLKYLRVQSTWNRANVTADAVRVLQNVHNDSVRLAVSGEVLTIAEWLDWAKNKSPARKQ